MTECSQWRYKTTIKKLYKLTDNQIRLAIEEELVRVREVENPYYSSKTALLICEDDVIKNLDKIREFPKYSEEERERHRIYRARSKFRAELSFYCPRCKRVIKPPRDSSSFEAAWNKELDTEKSRRLLIIAHYRHEHTDYEEVLKKNLDNIYGDCERHSVDREDYEECIELEKNSVYVYFLEKNQVLKRRNKRGQN